MHAPLGHWLRLLWGRSPAIAFDSDCAYIETGTIHLPPGPQWEQHAAAAAHAAAHLVYSPQRFDGTGLGPIARVLLALLEDARVEALAARELPGLGRLWRSLHTATPEIGAGFEGLAVRLARGLCDPGYHDPDPWIRKGRDLCFLDRDLSIPALRIPSECREIATRLGHDIGQMRLPFNSRASLPLPGYRDDHRWMWAADRLACVPPAPRVGSTPSEAETVDGWPDDAVISQHPEWDHRIARSRPDWCRVVETACADAAPAGPLATEIRAASRRLLAPVRKMAVGTGRPERSDAGDSFDVNALVDFGLGQRLGIAGPPRAYRSRASRGPRPELLLLIDQSASTASTGRFSGVTALALAAQSALTIGAALALARIEFSIAAFSSNGRHAVRWRGLKSTSQSLDAGVAARVEALRPEGSTRLGAVLRHAALRLPACGERPRWVLLLSDGQPHDIDVHDGAYLVDDARAAAVRARRQGVRLRCLITDPGSGGAAARIFGPECTSRLDGLSGLPRSLRRLLR